MPSVSEHRTQVYLPESMYRRVASYARTRDVSVAEVIRQALTLLLEGNPPETDPLMGIVGAANIPIVHFSVYWWRALHQPAAMLGPGSAPMPGWMKTVVLVNWIAFSLLFAYFLSRRLEIARLEETA